MTALSATSLLPKHACKLFTFDCGTKFSDCPRLMSGLGVGPWFCDPQSPLVGYHDAINCQTMLGRKARSKIPTIDCAVTFPANPNPRYSQTIFGVDLPPPQQNTAQGAGVSIPARVLHTRLMWKGHRPDKPALKNCDLASAHLNSDPSYRWFLNPYSGAFPQSGGLQTFKYG